MRSTVNKTRLAERIGRAAILSLLALSLSGCAVYEYLFGGPDTSEMPLIEMKRPEAAAATPDGIVHTPEKRQYPTRWTNGQLLD